MGKMKKSKVCVSEAEQKLQTIPRGPDGRTGNTPICHDLKQDAGHQKDTPTRTVSFIATTNHCAGLLCAARDDLFQGSVLQKMPARLGSECRRNDPASRPVAVP